jgi:PilZ domain
MAETKPGEALATGAEEGVESAAAQHQADGRYIPYSGGSLGWYENTGVPAREKSNNYGFHTAIDSEVVRAKQYLRAGLRSEKRRSARQVLKEEIPVTLKMAHDTKVGRVFDISKNGARVQYIGDDIQLANGEKLHLAFMDKAGGVTLELPCTVVRSWKAGKTRTLWNFGVDFPLLNEQQAAKLAAIGGLPE